MQASHASVGPADATVPAATPLCRPAGPPLPRGERPGGGAPPPHGAPRVQPHQRRIALRDRGLHVPVQERLAATDGNSQKDSRVTSWACTEPAGVPASTAAHYCPRRWASLHLVVVVHAALHGDCGWRRVARRALLAAGGGLRGGGRGGRWGWERRRRLRRHGRRAGQGSGVCRGRSRSLRGAFGRDRGLGQGRRGRLVACSRSRWPCSARTGGRGVVAVRAGDGVSRKLVIRRQDRPSWLLVGEGQGARRGLHGRKSWRGWRRPRL